MPKKQIDRRTFLKSASGLGVASLALPSKVMSSGLGTKNHTLLKTLPNDCEFSALASKFVYLNSGTEGSMPSCVLETLNTHLIQWASRPTYSYETDKILGKQQHTNREKVADFLCVKKNNICLTDNTTMGCSMILMGLDFGPNDKAIMTNHEHNAIASPLAVQHHKIGLKVIKRNFPVSSKLREMNSSQLIDYLFPNTPELQGAKALCVSHVYPATGTQLPLDLLRKKADELKIKYLVVDGAQAFGMLDLGPGSNAISHTDFYACPGHKWLNGPPSTGILYIKNEHIRPPELYPVLSQRMSKYENNQNFPMAEALQVRGCHNAPGFSAMLTAIDFVQNSGGPTLVERHIQTLSKRVKTFVHEHSAAAMISPIQVKELSSGLTVFFPFNWEQPNKIYRDKKTAAFVVDSLLKKGIRIRYIGFQDAEFGESYALRVSTALFNHNEHLDALETQLQAVLSQI